MILTNFLLKKMSILNRSDSVHWNHWGPSVQEAFKSNTRSQEWVVM